MEKQQQSFFGKLLPNPHVCKIQLLVMPPLAMHPCTGDALS
jgi:hypothetical protein